MNIYRKYDVSRRVKIYYTYFALIQRFDFVYPEYIKTMFTLFPFTNTLYRSFRYQRPCPICVQNGGGGGEFNNNCG